MLKYVVFLPLFVAFVSFSQDRATPERLERDKKICQAFAQKSFEELNGGFLLVRLSFRQKQVDYLMQRDSSEAKKVQEKAMSKNLKITKAFQDKYTFSGVYFFEASDSKHLKNQEFDSVTFYDHNLQVVDASLLQSDNYLIGEFGRIQQDTAQYYAGDRIYTQHSKEKTKVYYGGSKNGREAFIIMDRNFQQIRKPFPYFSPLQPFMSEQGRYRKALVVLEEKFEKYGKEVGDE